MPLDLQALPPWLDEETSALVREKAELLAQRHPDVLAIILYGSVARHEERSLDGPDPSDVDLLVVINGNRDAVRFADAGSGSHGRSGRRPAFRRPTRGQSHVFLAHLAGMGPGLHRQCEARWQNPLSARRASCPFRRLRYWVPIASAICQASTLFHCGRGRCFKDAFLFQEVLIGMVDV